MHRLTREQKIENLEEVLISIENKIQRLQEQKEGTLRNIKRLKGKPSIEYKNEETSKKFEALKEQQSERRLSQSSIF